MTIKYLKGMSTMLAVVSAVREFNLQRHLSVKRDILKLIFAFDHINYARLNTYQHVYLNNLLWTEKSVAKDYINNRNSASNSGCSFSNIHWDLASQYFSRETKERLGPFHGDLHHVK